MGFWKVRKLREEAREQDIELARRELVTSKTERQDVLDRSPLIATMSAYLAERRTLNHFGEALGGTGAMEPRRGHA